MYSQIIEESGTEGLKIRKQKLGHNPSMVLLVFVAFVILKTAILMAILNRLRRLRTLIGREEFASLENVVNSEHIDMIRTLNRITDLNVRRQKKEEFVKLLIE